MRVLEFYSGIGGWSSALRMKGIEHEIISAFDINTVSNEVYKHNYGNQPSSKSLETITVKYLNSLQADLWVMSPPCQPYTRNNETDHRDNNDPRSRSFLHIIDLLGKLSNPPKYIALENVVGFEESYCCELFISALRALHYATVQFHLTPTQFNVPNERPRYYCIAARDCVFPSVSAESSDGALLTSIPGYAPPAASTPRPLSAFLQSDLTPDELVRSFHRY